MSSVSSTSYNNNNAVALPTPNENPPNYYSFTPEITFVGLAASSPTDIESRVKWKLCDLVDSLDRERKEHLMYTLDERSVLAAQVV